MGAWGTGIFEDDTACDVRGDYQDCIGDGRSGAEATRWILNQYAEVLSDPDEGGVIWLALAAVQWTYRRLEDDTLNRALYVIDSGSDLERWKETKDREARRAELETLRAQITSPQPAEKKVKRRTPVECHLKRGDVIAYRLPSGKRVLLRVIDRFKDQGGTYPVCEILNWTREEDLAKAALKSIGLMPSRADYKHTIRQIMVCGLEENSPRVEKLGFRLKPMQKDHGPSIVHWKHLDGFLAEWFRLE